MKTSLIVNFNKDIKFRVFKTMIFYYSTGELLRIILDE